ncbi:MAG: HAD-IA family hydrolase [Rhizobacter sp.]|nr:HAD-IA family hydrolase [Rhizobacter sp.]
MSGIEAIAFDLDGTLVDTAGGIAHALNSALAEAGLPAFNERTVRTWIGDGPDALIARALGAHEPGTADPHGLAARLRRGFDAATLQAPMQGSSVFDGVLQLLATLAARHPLVVVTNKPTPLARAVLHAAGLLPHFAAVLGPETAEQRKPSPHLLQQAGEVLGVDTRSLLMVGDAEGDIAAARAAGCRAAWAGWGYTPHAPASVSTRVWRLHTPLDLLARLAPEPRGHTKNQSRRTPCPPVESPRSRSS